MKKKQKKQDVSKNIPRCHFLIIIAIESSLKTGKTA